MKPRKPIRRVSKKHGAMLRMYASIAKTYLETHIKCEICLIDDSEQIHHKAGRLGLMLVDPGNFMALCAECHDRVHRSPAWSRSQGFLLDRIGHE